MARGTTTLDAVRRAAATVFAEKGYHWATVADIARRAGVAPATIYRHFRGKRDLFASLSLPSRTGQSDDRPRSPAHLERRRAILGAALKVFARHGYHGASLAEIARTAGISKAALYLYFSGKQGLFAALCREQTSPLTLLEALSRPDTANAAAAAADLRGALTAVAESFLTLFEDPDSVNVLRLVLAEMPRFPEVGRVFSSEVVGKGTQALAGYFDRVVAGGETAFTDTTFAARTFIGMLAAHVIQTRLMPGPDGDDRSPREAGAKLVTIFLEGVLRGA